MTVASVPGNKSGQTESLTATGERFNEANTADKQLLITSLHNLVTSE